MIRPRSIVLAVALLAPSAGLSTEGCAEVPAITAGVVGEIQCVEAQVAAGNATFEGIAAACGPMLVGDVITIVGALAASTTPTAAMAAKVRHAGAAK